MSEEVVLLSALSRDRLRPGEMSEKLSVRLSLQTSDAFMRDHPVGRCALLLVLDGSGSMDQPFHRDTGTLSRREGVRRAVDHILRDLLSTDLVSLVTFSDRAQTRLRNAPGTDHAAIRDAAAALTGLGGCTSFPAAFREMAAWAAQVDPACARRVLFLTDGEHNQGPWQEVERLNAELAGQAVVVDCLGVGAEFRFDQTQALSAVSNGRTFHLDRPEDARSRFADLLLTAQRSLVHHVLVRLDVPLAHRDVELYQRVPEVRRLGGDVQTTASGRLLSARIGSLFHMSAVELLLALTVDVPERALQLPLARYRIDYDIPSLGIRGAVAEGTVEAQVGGEEEVDTLVEDAMREVRLMKLEEEFRGHYGSKDWKEAARILGKMAKVAEALGLPEKQRLYSGYEQKLLADHAGLTRDDLNRLYAATSVSTVAAAGRQPT